ATIAVRDYWNSVAQSNLDPQAHDRWVLELVSSRPPHHRTYGAPGSLWLDVTSRAARISTGGRWRGFIEIERLREVHLQAFKTIAKCLQSKTLVICSD